MKDAKQTLAFSQRPEFFRDVKHTEWQDWRWQQRNAVKDFKGLQKVFPNIQHPLMATAGSWQQRGFRFALTPYMLWLMRFDSAGNPIPSNPVWRQFFPPVTESSGHTGVPADEYSPNKENWENVGEMITPICQWKYDNRAIIYTADSCLAYCTFCLRSLQSTDPHEKHGGRPHWQATMEAIRHRPEIKEIILSGGDPMIYDNAAIDEMLRDIRSIPSVEMIRIHTRAWTHNPYRIDEGFCELLRRHEVTEMAVHVNHPDEISGELQEAIGRIRESGARTILLSQSALLKGVNDDATVLRKHFLTLYSSGVKPYYLLHCMPNVPSAREQRTSVCRGAELMQFLKRHISNPAMPEYCIVHETGKKTVPEALDGSSEFVYTRRDSDGHPIVHFKNWKGVWCDYLDGQD